jgi:hypothetical protein
MKGLIASNRAMQVFFVLNRFLKIAEDFKLYLCCWRGLVGLSVSSPSWLKKSSTNRLQSSRRIALLLNALRAHAVGHAEEQVSDRRGIGFHITPRL